MPTATTTEDSAEPVIAAERALLDPRVRRESASVDALLSSSFREIGASGRVFDRTDIMDALAGEGAVESFVVEEMNEIVTHVVSVDLVLLTYRLKVSGRTSRRSSLWRLTPQGPRLEFHQGTPTS